MWKSFAKVTQVGREARTQTRSAAGRPGILAGQKLLWARWGEPLKCQGAHLAPGWQGFRGHRKPSLSAGGRGAGEPASLCSIGLQPVS